ncbi:MAG: hypothetical protein DWQ46_17550 [Planctomycetota bacterium]|nr:MAG: hypothetical protein DWQ46_17550 [Planctomycetota bacterium]
MRYQLLSCIALLACLAYGCGQSSTTVDVLTHVDEAADEGAALTRPDPLTLQDVTAEIEAVMETAQQYAEQQREQYRRQVQDRVAKIQKQIDELRDLVENRPPAIDTEIQALFQRMEAQLGDARNRMVVDRADTEEAWKNLRAAVDTAVTQLEESATSAREHITGSTLDNGSPTVAPDVSATDTSVADDGTTTQEVNVPDAASKERKNGQRTSPETKTSNEGNSDDEKK